MRRHNNTATEILAAGDFIKIGKRHYRHASGREARWNHNAWAWEAEGRCWPALWVAVEEIRKAAQG